jgi:phosphomannomutase
MEDSGSFIGGEESGGFAYSDHLIERDGIMSSLLLLESLSYSEEKPSNLLKSLNQKLGNHFYKRIDIPIEEKESTPKIRQFIKEPNISSFGGNKITKLDQTDGLKINLENGDWIALRLSGTEPLIRFYCESSNQSQLDSMLNEILKKLDISIS